MTISFASLLRRVIPRYTFTSQNPPVDMVEGEIAVNFSTKKLYAKGSLATPLEFLDSAGIRSLATKVSGGELDHLGSLPPPNPIEGMTWREVTIAGAWVADWEFRAEFWVEARPSVYPEKISTSNTVIVDIPTPAGRGTWAVNFFTDLVPTASSGVWRVTAYRVFLPPGVSMQLQQKLQVSSQPGQPLIASLGWEVWEEAAMLRLSIDRPGGAGGLNGAAWVDWRRLR